MGAATFPPSGNDSKLQGWEHALIAKVETHRETSGRSLIFRSDPSVGRRSADQWAVPVLRARRGGPAERLAGVFGDLHPAVVFAVVMLVGLAAIAVVSIGVGFFVTRVVEQAWGIGAAD